MRSSLRPWRRRNRERDLPAQSSRMGSGFPSNTPFFDDFFNEAFSSMLSPWTTSMLSPRLGWEDMWGQQMGPLSDTYETDDSYVMRFDVPGYSKDEIDIEVSGNTVIVSGERKEEQEEGSRRRGRSFAGRYDSFQQAFTLPEEVDPNRVAANYQNGVLEVSIPKGEESKRTRIPINEGMAKRAIDTQAQQREGREGREGRNEGGEQQAS
jgi:HSP20 family protein